MAQNESCSIRDGALETPDGRRRIEVNVAPLEPRPPFGYFVVSFVILPDVSPVLPPPDDIALPPNRLVEEQLARVQHELQSTVEELQTSNEEMKASNEEVTSVNEELQSTNEELETSKEELQSLNEELTTVNAQLQAKMEELESTNNDLASLLSSTSIAVIFLDTQFRIRRFTPAVTDLLDLIPADVGRPLSDLAKKFDDPDLLTDARAVLEKLVPVEKEITSESRRIYMRRALPYRTNDNRIAGVVVTFIDITARTRAELALRESHERHRVILESITDYAIFMLDEEGRVATWTLGAERVLGYTEAEALHLPLTRFTVPEERDHVATQLQTAREHGSATEEGWHQRKDGSRFWSSGILSALKDNSGQHRGFVKVLRDNTDRKLAEEALRQAKRAADLASDAKDQFLATVSHELRTPMSAIVLWATLIEDQKAMGPEQLAEALSAIRRSAEEQRELIEDLVDTSRIVTGKLHLDLKSIPLEPAVRRGIESCSELAKEKNVEIAIDLDPKLGSGVADGSRLQQVLANLVGNAVKFTPAGGRITVTARRVDDEVRIDVADTGIGIDSEILPNIFERFVQGDDVSTRSSGGLGLGLAIVKQIVELHGGSIHVDSAGINHGSTFTVRLPLPSPAAAADAPLGAILSDSKSPFRHTLQDVKILLIEDVVATRRAPTAVLQEAGARVVAVESAPAAWETLGRQRPDILISDLGLPTTDGYALIRHIRDTETEAHSPRLPAIALTAFAGEAIARKAMDHGFDICLTKPIESPKLVAAIVSLISTHAS